jgi:GrpB-like predicted nucleotidyltransferase (UPF0157 family)
MAPRNRPLPARSKSKTRTYEVLLYVLPAGHDHVAGWIRFREFMRRLPENIERYTATKKTAIADGKTEPWRYQEAKTPYVVELERRIEREASHR